MTYILAAAIILALFCRRKRRLHERDEDMRVWVARRYPNLPDESTERLEVSQ